MPRKSREKEDVFQFISIRVKDGKPDTEACWPWHEDAPVSGRDDRPTFTYKGRRYLAYRVVYELFTGEELSPDEVVRHKCDNKQCCNPHHLEKGTHQENMNDMKSRERHGLPHHTVRAIKTLLLAGSLTHEQIAQNFGISRQTVTAIKGGTIYSHVTLESKDDTNPNENSKD